MAVIAAAQLTHVVLARTPGAVCACIVAVPHAYKSCWSACPLLTLCLLQGSWARAGHGESCVSWLRR